MIFFASNSFVSAQGCQTCNQPPDDLQTYFSVMDELLDALKLSQPDLSSKTQVGEDAKEILFATKAGLQSAAMTTILATIIPIHVAFFDTRGEMKTLASSESRRRDRESLTEVDRKIMFKALAIAKNGYMGKKLSKEHLGKIDTIIQKLGYVELNKASAGSYVMFLQGVTYDGILGVYRHLNDIYKTLHRQGWYRTDLGQVGSEYQVAGGSNKENAIKKIEKETLQKFLLKIEQLVVVTYDETQQELRGPTSMRLHFKDNYIKFAVTIWEIQDAYDCSTGVKNKCDSDRTDTIANSRDTTKERSKKDRTAAINTFTLAIERFRGTFQGQKGTYKKVADQREEELMNSIYGGETPEKRKRWSVVNVEGDGNIEEASVETQALIKRIEKSQLSCLWDSTVDCRKTLFSSSTLSQTPKASNQADANKYATKSEKEIIFGDYKPNLKQTRWNSQEIDLRSLNSAKSSQDQIDAIKSVFVEVLHMQSQKQVTSVFADTKRVTKQFPTLSASVYRNMDLRGKKNEPGNTQGSTIYNSMGKVCELQCTNLQGKCWYHTD